MLEDAEADALAYLDFPPSHWKRLRTNNVQERTNREIKRRSRVIQVFPSRAALMRVVGAVLADVDEGWQQSRYFGGEDVRGLALLEGGGRLRRHLRKRSWRPPTGPPRRSSAPRRLRSRRRRIG